MKGFDYFQLVMLVLFYTIFLGRGIVMRLTKKIKAVPSNAGKDVVSVVVEKSFRVVWVVFAVYVAAYAMHAKAIMIPEALHSRFLFSQPAQIVAVLLIFCGYAFFLWAIISMSDSWRMGVDNENPGSLVTTRAFKISRNPVFLFMDIYFVATFLINGTWFFLILAVVMILGIHYQIIQEEKSLTARYGQAYLEYKARVRRYI